MLRLKITATFSFHYFRKIRVETKSDTDYCGSDLDGGMETSNLSTVTIVSTSNFYTRQLRPGEVSVSHAVSVM